MREMRSGATFWRAGALQFLNFEMAGWTDRTVREIHTERCYTSTVQ